MNLKNKYLFSCRIYHYDANKSVHILLEDNFECEDRNKNVVVWGRVTEDEMM